MTVAVYPGRFDPVTIGHMDIVQRAAKLFDRLVVAVLDYEFSGPPSATAVFTTEERVALFSKAVEGYPNVTVTAYQGLTVDFARRESAGVLVRGIRAVTDFEAELDMALMNKTMAPEIESVYLMASLDHLYISGHRIREVASLGYDVGDLVPAQVVAMLEKKIKR
ncbi:MAG: pantetheine-phosphate adenylyltransferase [Chloroflexi bacterium]|nr:pantetheine-phosphate adenylyltransferase [Chloroflexota bacterium]